MSQLTRTSGTAEMCPSTYRLEFRWQTDALPHMYTYMHRRIMIIHHMHCEAVDEGNLRRANLDKSDRSIAIHCAPYIIYRSPTYYFLFFLG
jgi:hypothetical protein